MSRRPEDAGRRAQLVRESARLFREKGYDATSVRDIAAATGLQSGSWVYHFKTKQDILAAVMEEGLQRALERIEGSQRYRLHAGPLMRRYLDGYLPMQARLAFQWPDGLLRLKGTQPAGQPGVTVNNSSTGAQLDLVFAGRMTATLDLVRGTP